MDRHDIQKAFFLQFQDLYPENPALAQTFLTTTFLMCFCRQQEFHRVVYRRVINEFMEKIMEVKFEDANDAADFLKNSAPDLVQKLREMI